MKKFILSLTIVMMIVCSFVVPAQAKTATRPEDTVRFKLAEVKADVANLEVEVVVKIGQLTSYNDVEWVVRTTDFIIASAKSFINRLGFDVECDYVNYNIDGVIVSIDPIRVVTPDDGDGE